MMAFTSVDFPPAVGPTITVILPRGIWKFSRASNGFGSTIGWADSSSVGVCCGACPLITVARGMYTARSRVWTALASLSPTCESGCTSRTTDSCSAVRRKAFTRPTDTLSSIILAAASGMIVSGTRRMARMAKAGNTSDARMSLPSAYAVANVPKTTTSGAYVSTIWNTARALCIVTRWTISAWRVSSVFASNCRSHDMNLMMRIPCTNSLTRCRRLSVMREARKRPCPIVCAAIPCSGTVMMATARPTKAAGPMNRYSTMTHATMKTGADHTCCTSIDVSRKREQSVPCICDTRPVNPCDAGSLTDLSKMASMLAVRIFMKAFDV
mmetsp:Transcript_17832/g.55339  ORF Transcript_17832/g.55339 Transcript_17832/m.55339 type:complete len:326 (+) Transcript_17832:89-1066(+)